MSHSSLPINATKRFCERRATKLFERARDCRFLGALTTDLECAVARALAVYVDELIGQLLHRGGYADLRSDAFTSLTASVTDVPESAEPSSFTTALRTYGLLYASATVSSSGIFTTARSAWPAMKLAVNFLRC